MACRVGMAKAANVHGRIQQWMRQEGHSHWEILHEHMTYDAATNLERHEASVRGCTQEAGGPRDYDSDWCVYIVSGG